MCMMKRGRIGVCVVLFPLLAGEIERRTKNLQTPTQPAARTNAMLHTRYSDAQYSKNNTRYRILLNTILDTRYSTEK